MASRLTAVQTLTNYVAAEKFDRRIDMALARYLRIGVDFAVGNSTERSDDIHDHTSLTEQCDFDG